MASLEANKQFLGELDKVQQRLNDAVKSANEVGRQKFNMDMSLAQQGLISRVDPQTGQQVIGKLSPEENTVLQAKFANKQALAIADQDLANTLRQNQIGADIATLEDPEAVRLRELTRGIKKEEAAITREETAKDLQARVDAEVEALESESGKKLSELKKKEIADRIKTEVRAQAEAAISPEVREAKQQAAIDKILVETSPEAINARQKLFEQRLANNLQAFEQKMLLEGKLSEQQIAISVEGAQAAAIEIAKFTNTVDVVQAAKIFESARGLPPGTLNPLSTKEQIRALGEVSEQRTTQKALESGQIAIQLEPTISQAFEAINFEFDDLEDSDDLKILVGPHNKLNSEKLDSVIRNISETTGFNNKQVADAIIRFLAVEGQDIAKALEDLKPSTGKKLAEGASFKGAQEFRDKTAKQLRFLRDRLKRIKKAGIE